ncbi:hypothetical protein [Bradyrhizobium sp. 6(2017)]|uniref:hypothetical protein n=1 Tax=Bradyrhizobium sp. 6(2017) TaxID=1197460 RepID=UPI0013E0EFB7|nr:hypothetical protein [Bradyrhizobium sp. 6(2017)]QIG95505.1 hypothetical protein G6P99_25950 [Bradyrhizobium sp. 6(2017)]
MRTSLVEWIVLAVVYICTAGVAAKQWGEQRKSLTGLIAILAFVQLVWFFRDRWVEWFKTEDKKEQVEPASRTTQLPGPIGIPRVDPVQVAYPRMFWGTLPPDGNPAVVYSVTNGGTLGLKNVSASAWIMEGQNARKLDERYIGYLGQSETREERVVLPSTPYGRGLLCVSFTYAGSTSDVLHFFQSVGEYAKYGPMREMQRFRDPIAQNNVCQSLGAQAATLINQP